MKNQIRKSIVLSILLFVGLISNSNSANAGEIVNNQGFSFQMQQSNQNNWNNAFTIAPQTNYSFDLGLKTPSPFSKEGKTYKRKSPFLAAALNFVLPGAGYLYNGQQHPLLSVGMMIGAVGLTYVEFNIKETSPNMYPIMFGSVALLNTSISIDTFFKTKKKNELHNL